MTFPVSIYQGDDGRFLAECLVIPGCRSSGTTEEEALKSIREAIVVSLRVRSERGLPLVVETREIDVPLPAALGAEFEALAAGRDARRAEARRQELLARTELYLDELRKEVGEPSPEAHAQAEAFADRIQKHLSLASL